MKASDVRKLKKRIAPAYTEMFSGRVYKVGEGAVSVRNHSGEARHTVIGVHGFLENHCYFTQLYQEPTTELILLTCSNYHIPVSGPNIERPDWVQRNTYPLPPSNTMRASWSRHLRTCPLPDRYGSTAIQGAAV